MNMKTVAEIAGVSFSTVAKALKDSNEISEATKVRVRKIAEENGYVYNPHARKLKGLKTKTIGLIFEYNDFYAYNFDNLLVDVIRKVTKVITRKGYDFLIQTERSDVANIRDSSIFRLAATNSVDGVILVGRKIPAKSFQMLEETKFPYIAAFFAPDELFLAGKNFVLEDQEYDGWLGTKYLIDKGFRKIIALSTNKPDEHPDYHRREIGYCRAMSESGLKPEIISCSMDFQGAEKIVSDHFVQFKSCDAIFGFWDGVALGTMVSLQKRGIIIPEEISVLGYNDSKLYTLFTPAISSFHDPQEEMAEQSVKRLVEMIEQGFSSTEGILIRGRVHERNSIKS